MGTSTIEIITIVLIAYMVGIFTKTIVVWDWGGVLDTKGYDTSKNKHSP